MISEITEGSTRLFELRVASPNAVSYIEWDSLGESQGDLKTVTLHGHSKVPVEQIKLNGMAIPLQQNRFFTLEMSFPGEDKYFDLQILDRRGNSYQTTYLIGPSDFDPEMAKRKTSRWRQMIGVGYTLITYEQTSVPQFTENVITVKGGVGYAWIPRKLDLGVSAFYNAAVLSTQSEFKVQYLGVNVRAGYHLVDGRGPSRVIVNGGLYYNTSFSGIGFANVFGPQFYPEYTYRFQNGHALMMYGKYSPVFVSGAFDFQENREMAIGAHYSIPFLENRISVGVDYSSLQLKAGLLTVKTSTISGSLSYSF